MRTAKELVENEKNYYTYTGSKCYLAPTVEELMKFHAHEALMKLYAKCSISNEELTAEKIGNYIGQIIKEL